MNGQEAMIQRLDERTEHILKYLDSHTKQDNEKFDAVFEKLDKISVSLGRVGIIGSVVWVFTQILLAAWVKGMF